MQTPAKVVYVVIDGMGTEPFERAVASGRAPALAAIKERAHYARDSVAVFPTITPAATASLVTGTVPAEHRIPGMCWYDRLEQRFVNYGQSPRVAIVESLGQIVEDVLDNLNQRHLSPKVKTLHEELDALGFVTASINFMIFRGPHRLELKPNLLERLLFRRRLPRILPGPREHYFADVVDGESGACTKMLSTRRPSERIRATDAWAACVTRELLERDAADMILFYLHENDHLSHRSGPGSQVDNLVEADRHVATVLDTFGSWDATFDRVGFVVTADHSQSPVADDDGHILDLNEILDGFTRVEPGRGEEPFGDADLAAAGNGRVAFVYLNEGRRELLRRPVVDALLDEPGIDQVMWREHDGYAVSSRRGFLRFRQALDGVRDERGDTWAIEGDLEAVGGQVEGGELRTPEYPLALWRIRSALDLDRIGDVVATMGLTYEVKDLAGGHHKGGGDHGSLHAQDSLVPFLSTLAKPPLRPVTSDVAPHITAHFQMLRST
jgi:hypothetical protein